jgi:cation:H+ antiporter
MVAALRGHGEMAIGNVIGSNIFNLLLILGVASSLSPIVIPLETLVLDLAFMIGLTLFAIAALAPRRKLTRFEGLLLGASYLSFLGLLAYQAA